MMWLHVLIMIAGLGILVKGSDYFVESASRIAKSLGVSEFVIGLTLVAIGTSAPELATSIIAAFNGYSDVVISGVIGSNIANIGLILGLTASIAVVKTHTQMLKRDGYIMMFAVALFFASFSMVKAKTIGLP